MSKDSELSPDAGGMKGHLSSLPLSLGSSRCGSCGLCGLFGDTLSGHITTDLVPASAFYMSVTAFLGYPCVM